MPTTRQAIVVAAVLSVLLVPSMFLAKSTPSDGNRAVKQIAQHLRRAESAFVSMRTEGRRSAQAETQLFLRYAKALDQANAIAKRALAKRVDLAAVRQPYERAIGGAREFFDPAVISGLTKPASYKPAVLRARRSADAAHAILQEIHELAAESERRRTAASGQQPVASPIAANDNAPPVQPQDPRRQQALQDPVFTYLSVDIPDRLNAQAGVGYESPDLLGGARVTPATPICPQCEDAIILSVVTTMETDADLAKYPIVLNGEDRGIEQINGVTWRHFILNGKAGPFEVYAVIQNGRRYQMELLSQGLWSEQDRAGIVGYDAAAARSFADDFSRIARSARILR